ncbi:thioredoxin family protein [Pseudooceanicola sp. LIPI14-2-Ac024]|uniref:thioredoxin family protein n=1 Tax=Pseudooceanicola sp. LIPI14-2-Ac024 TaxID=3344875 RepID=UPI0035D02F6D
MKRRDFMGLAAAGLVLPRVLSAAPLEFTPGLVAQRLAAGDTVFLDFKASWCSTCAAQEKVLTRLKAANPDYEANITFIDVDWDTYGRSTYTQSMNIPRRSTLVVLKGDQEIGRLVAETREAEIKALLDAALSAAMA